MATSSVGSLAAVYYPDSDGRPVGETPQHRDNLFDAVFELRAWYAADPMVYVSGNMFVYYVPGNRLRHVSPDVFVVKGVPKLPERRRYLVWEEGKGPDVVFEFTSESTREEDLDDKFAIYRDELKVTEYFLCDPYGEYLQPPLKGYRLCEGQYVRIQPVEGRLPSEVLSLHLEQEGWQLRLYDPARKVRLPTPEESVAQMEAAWQRAELARQQAEIARQQAEVARQQVELAKQQAEFARQQAEAEAERLRRELDALRQRLPKDS